MTGGRDRRGPEATADDFGAAGVRPGEDFLSEPAEQTDRAPVPRGEWSEIRDDDLEPLSGPLEADPLDVEPYAPPAADDDIGAFDTHAFDALDVDRPALDALALELAPLPGPSALDESDLEQGTEYAARPPLSARAEVASGSGAAASWALDPVYVVAPPTAPELMSPVFAPAPAPVPRPAPSPTGASPTGRKADAWVGRLVANRYQIERELAAGGMGRVYVATQVPLGRPVAIKVVRTEIHGSRQQFVRRFFLEAAACAKLTHPNIVTIHDYGETEDGEVFMAMEYLDGRSLDQEIKDTAPMPAERALHIAIQVSRALREAHAKGIIHRDLKPQNVMLVEQGDERDFVKVLDFGLVKMLSNTEEAQREVELTRAGVLLGSPNYMSPEQILGGNLDGRTDIYSLGVVLFKMLAGKNPFARDSEMDVIYKHVHVAPPTMASQAVDVHPAAEAVVMRCLSKRPEERYADCKELVIALKEARREVLGQAAKKRKKKPAAAAIEPPVVAPAAPEPVVIVPPVSATPDDSRGSAPSASLSPPSMPSVAPPSGRPSDVAALRTVPSRVYLRARDTGLALGPLPLAQLEVLFATRVIDDSTPLSLDGLAYDDLGASAKLRDHLGAYRQRLVDGGRPWEVVRTSMAPEGGKPTSLLSVLFRAAADGVTGVLTQSRTDGTLRLSYVEGKILEVDTDIPALSLTRYLLGQRVFTQAALDDQLPIPPSRSGDLGDALIAAGLVPPHVFMEQLVSWARWALGGALTGPSDGVVLESTPPPPPQIPLSFDRFGVLIEAVRANAEPSVVQHWLSALASRAVIPSSPQGAKAEDLKLAPRELRMVRQVDGTKTVAELVAGAKNDKELLEKTLYYGIQIGLVVLGDDAQVQRDRAEAQRLLGVLAKLRDKSPFEVLNVGESASDDEVRGRYMEVVKLYHPDNARSGSAPELSDALRQLFVLVQECFASVESSEKREKYRSLRDLGYTGKESEEEVVRRVVEAEVSFKKAKTLVRLRKYEDAVAELRQAVTKKPRDLEFKIHLRHAEYLADRTGDRVQGAQRAAEDILKLLKSSDNELASPFLLLAQLYRVLNQDEAAVKAYKRVLKFDPRNHEAESELRLMNLREQKRQKKGGLNIGGLLGSLGQNKDK
jgi:serine/threonine protein kinase/tetratricopeptide (TPR) repeat protein